MPLELTLQGIRESRRAIVGWTAGIAAYIALIAAIFPSVKDMPNFDELIASYPEILKSLFGISEGMDISSGAGFLDAELFSFMLPLFVLVLAIGAGARTLAGEEDAGRLELVLSYPLRRRDAVLAKGAVVAFEVVVVSAAAGLTMLVFDPLVGLELSHGRLIASTLGLVVLGLVHGWLALAIGAAYPSRALAIGIPAGLAAVSYLVNGLHGLAEWLDPFRFVSPFWLIGSAPLQNGIDVAGALVVLAAAVAALTAGAVLVERRDLQVP